MAKVHKKEFKGREFYIKRKDNRLVVRLKPHEWATLESLRLRLQLPTYSKVVHRLIAISDILMGKMAELLKEKEELIKKWQI